MHISGPDFSKGLEPVIIDRNYPNFRTPARLVYNVGLNSLYSSRRRVRAIPIFRICRFKVLAHTIVVGNSPNFRIASHLVYKWVKFDIFVEAQSSRDPNFPDLGF